MARILDAENPSEQQLCGCVAQVLRSAKHLVLPQEQGVDIRSRPLFRVLLASSIPPAEWDAGSQLVQSKVISGPTEHAVLLHDGLLVLRCFVTPAPGAGHPVLT